MINFKTILSGVSCCMFTPFTLNFVSVCQKKKAMSLPVPSRLIN